MSLKTTPTADAPAGDLPPLEAVFKGNLRAAAETSRRR